MRKHWGLALGLIAVLVVAGMWLDPTQSVLGWLKGDAFYGGRPTSYWREALTGAPATKEAALATLKSPQAVPVLREMLRNGAGSGSAGAARFTAVEILSELGPDGHEAGPELLAALADPDPLLPSVAAVAIPKVGVPAETAVPALSKLLDTPAAAVAARAISTYKSQAKEALPQLVAVMKDKSRETETRWNAVRTVGKIGPDAASAVPDLIDLMQDEEPTVREHAAEAVGDIGPKAAQAVPALVELLDDPHTKVRRDSVRSLGQIGSAAKVAVEEMIKLLDDPESIVRDAAKAAILAISPESMPKTLPKSEKQQPAEDNQTKTE